VCTSSERESIVVIYDVKYGPRGGSKSAVWSRAVKGPVRGSVRETAWEIQNLFVSRAPLVCCNLMNNVTINTV